MQDFEKHEEMKTGIYLDGTMQRQLKEQSTKLMITFFFKDNLFSDSLRNYSQIFGNIVGITLSNPNATVEGSFW